MTSSSEQPPKETYRLIPLTKGLFSMVDPEYFDTVNQFRWHAHKSKNTYYAIHMTRYPDGRRRHMSMQDLVGFPPKDGLMVDHIDGNGLNNKKSNLRYVTNRQNSQNLHIEKSSQFPGVNWDKRDKVWRSHIRVNGRYRHLGLFHTEEAAGLRYFLEAMELEA